MTVKRPNSHAFALILALSVAGPLAACARVDYVEIEPNQVNLRRRGEGQWLRAKPMSRNGVYYPRLPVTWTSDNPKACSVDSVGRITAVGSGHAVITAEVSGHKASVDVDVQTVERVQIEPATVTMAEDAAAFHPKVIPLDGDGHELRGRTIDMKAADPNVIDVDGENLYPVSPGHTLVTVRADDRKADIDVTVVAKGKAGAKANAKTGAKKPAPHP
jgi:hypothetical protein